MNKPVDSWDLLSMTILVCFCIVMVYTVLMSIDSTLEKIAENPPCTCECKELN